MFLVILSLFVFAKCSKLPNFVIVLTDDQDITLGSLSPMKSTVELVGGNGKYFVNSFVSSPICCPSRSTILTGKYAHNLQVTNNSISGNCSSQDFQNSFEKDSIAALLKKEKNYVTFYGGKYLNQYGYKKSGGLKHVPKGYDWWLGLQGNSKYYNYSLSVNGTKEYFSNTYLTDYLAEQALAFLNQHRIKTEPFMMTIATPASHAPFIPAERHRNAFRNIKAPRTAPFNYTANDKHWLVQMPPQYLPTDVNYLDEIYRNRLRTLLAVDELVQQIWLKLKQLGILENTYIFFTSDNGYHIGQFTQPFDKRQPYESDIRVPFIVSGPGIIKKSITEHPTTAVDLWPTILDLAQVKKEILQTSDGISLKKELLNKKITPRNFHRVLLIEYWGESSPKSISKKCSLHDRNLSQCSPESFCKCQDSRNNTYSCSLAISSSSKFKFCQFSDNKKFTEAYDLEKDPHELKNLHFQIPQPQMLTHARLLNSLKKCIASTCRTPST